MGARDTAYAYAYYFMGDYFAIRRMVGVGRISARMLLTGCFNDV